MALLERRELRISTGIHVDGGCRFGRYRIHGHVETALPHLGFLLPLAPAYLIRFRSANASFLIPLGGIAPLCFRTQHRKFDFGK